MTQTKESKTVRVDRKFLFNVLRKVSDNDDRISDIEQYIKKQKSGFELNKNAQLFIEIHKDPETDTPEKVRGNINSFVEKIGQMLRTHGVRILKINYTDKNELNKSKAK